MRRPGDLRVAFPPNPSDVNGLQPGGVIMFMRIIKNRWFIVGIVLVLLAVPSAWLMARGNGKEDTSLVARVKKGEFKVNVTTSGELRATKFVRITAPQNAQAAQQWQMKIASL